MTTRLPPLCNVVSWYEPSEWGGQHPIAALSCGHKLLHVHLGTRPKRKRCARCAEQDARCMYCRELLAGETFVHEFCRRKMAGIIGAQLHAEAKAAGALRMPEKIVALMDRAASECCTCLRSPGQAPRTDQHAPGCPMDKDAVR